MAESVSPEYEKYLVRLYERMKANDLKGGDAPRYFAGDNDEGLAFSQFIRLGLAEGTLRGGLSSITGLTGAGEKTVIALQCKNRDMKEKALDNAVALFDGIARFIKP